LAHQVLTLFLSISASEPFQKLIFVPNLNFQVKYLWHTHSCWGEFGPPLQSTGGAPLAAMY